MPFAKKFRAMMDFPFPGDTLEGFTIERVDVWDIQGGSKGYIYGVEMVLRGLGGQQGAKRALKSLFAQHPTTFSGYGNPYQLWFRKPEIESLGDKRYLVRVEGSGARIHLAPELERFMSYVVDEEQLELAYDPESQEALVERYLEQYRTEIKRKVDRYRRKLKKVEGKE